MRRRETRIKNSLKIHVGIFWKIFGNFPWLVSPSPRRFNFFLNHTCLENALAESISFSGLRNIMQGHLQPASWKKWTNPNLFSNTKTLKYLLVPYMQCLILLFFIFFWLPLTLGWTIKYYGLWTFWKLWFGFVNVYVANSMSMWIIAGALRCVHGTKTSQIIDLA